jgi:hypothetical protein
MESIVTELFCVIKVNACQAPPKLHRPFQKASFIMEVDQRNIITLLVEEGMIGLEIINTLNKRDGRDALHRMQMC